MDKSDIPIKKFSSLREHAEEIAASNQTKPPEIPSLDTQALIHELQVHQIELEMQNEELRTAQEIIENSRQRFSDLYDFAPVGYLTINNKGIINEANLTSSELLGCDRTSLIGKPLTIYVNRADQDILYHHLRTLRGGQSHTCELRLTRRNELDFFAQLVSVPFGNAEKSVKDFLISVFNISPRILAEETRLQLASIVDGTDDAIISETLDGTIVSWNKGAEKIYGYAEHEVKGKSISILAPPDRPDEIPELLRKVVNAGELVKHSETISRRKDGVLIPVSLTVSPVRTDEGKIIGASTIARDITIHRKWEDSILELNRRLQISNRELESLGHVLSHDLQAPIRGIESFAKILEEDYSTALDDNGKLYLRRVIENTHRMEKMVAGLLKISRISITEMTRENIDLSNLVKIIAREFKEAEPGRGVEFTIQNGICVDGDASLVRLAVENLLRNAWKFTSKLNDAVIEFGNVESRGKNAFFIRDNGAGFSMRNASKMFIIFETLHSQSDFEGTGIGLATVQRIILRHGGEIWAEGEVGKGASFYFTFG
jgi:PAS domain S-box-containing protein